MPKNTFNPNNREIYEESDIMDEGNSPLPHEVSVDGEAAGVPLKFRIDNLG